MAKENTFEKKNHRIPIFYAIFAIAFSLLLLALGYRQIYLNDYYIQQAQRQSMRRIIEPGTRGNIYDRNAKLVVSNRPIFSAVVYFNDIRKEFREEYYTLKPIELKRLKTTGESFDYRKLASQARSNVLNRYLKEINDILQTNYQLSVKRYDKHFLEKPLLPMPLVRNLTAREHAILAERIPVDSPIQIYTDTARYYPYGNVASHTLGYVSNNFDDDTSTIPGSDLRTYAIVPTSGKSGIEWVLNDYLTGTSGAKIWIVDPLGFKYENVLDLSPTKGKDVFISLDIDIQEAIESKFEGKKGAAVMLDVKTGEVLAMVSEPSYDPNSLTPYISNEVNADITERGAWLNRATQGLYPPGSTFKIITAIAGMQQGVVDDTTVKSCDGGVKVGSRLFPCNNRYGHGYLDLVGALTYSCNSFFYEIGIEAGIDSISKVAKEFGLDSSPNIELKENSWRRSIVPNPEYKQAHRASHGSWTNGDTANTSIGQGFLLNTPMQVACFIASFARGETRTKASIIHDDTRVYDINYHNAKKLNLTKKQYDTIVKGMVEAVNRGTCKRAKLDNIQVAAKSGTAQITQNGRPMTLAWMVAFAPVDDPKVAISVIVEGQVQGDVSGGSTAGPIVKSAFENYKGW